MSTRPFADRGKQSFENCRACQQRTRRLAILRALPGGTA